MKNFTPNFSSSRALRIFSTLVLITTLCICNAWGDTSTLSFTAKCNGSGTADDGASWTVSSDGTESTFDSTKGIHYGTNSAQVTYITLTTSDISGTITKVVVNASTASGVSATVSVTVGGSAFGGDAKSLTTSAADYTFTGSASGEIVVTITKPSKAVKAIYCKSIEVTYSSGGGGGCTAPTISSHPAGATYTVGDTPTALSITASGSPTYQWYSNTSASNSGGTTISGATNSTYTPSTESAGTFYYYCVASSGSGCNTASNVATITVNASSGGGGGDCGIFHETWDSTSGTGGNDGEWSGSIASSTINADKSDWTYNKSGGAKACVKLGNSSTAGVATTPSISVTSGSTYSLTFKAGAWSGDGTSLTLSASGATLDETSFTMGNAAWATLSTTITATSSSMSITFTGAKRFFLDEVCISNVTLAPINVTLSRNGSTETVNSVTVGTALDDIDGSGDQGGCDDWKFVGWTKTERTEQDNTATMTLVTKVDDAGPYYAVYKHTEGGEEGSTYTFSSTDKDVVAAESPITVATGVTVTFSQGSNTTLSPYVDSDEVIRVYYKNTITVSSSGDNLTRIEFTQTSGSNTISVSTGSMSGLVWTGDANSVTFTLGGTSGHRKITAITIGGGGTTYYSTAATCGPNIKITGQKWVTSTAGQTIKAILTVRASMFKGAATMSASSSNNSKFSITNTGAGLANNAISAAGTAETTLTVEYTPTVSTDGTEQTTLTVSATDPSEGTKTATFSLNGRHLPANFLMIAKNGDTWWALPANMSGADKYAGIEVTVNDADNPTNVAVAPFRTLYSLAAVNSANYAEYGDKVRFVGNLQKMLWGTDSNSAGTINNNAQYGVANENKTHNYEWTLGTEDGIEYTIQNVAYDIKDGNTAGYYSLKYYSSYSRFGMYVNGQKQFRFVTATCSTQPYVSNIETTHNSATLTWAGDPSVTYNLFVKQGGSELTSLHQTGIESPLTIEGLTGETTYTFIISPSTISDACRLEGELTTLSAPISFTLSRRGVTETISNVQKPYELPVSGNACDEWTFVGWSASTVAEGSTSYSNVTHATTDGATYYAVYRNVSGGGSVEYTKVTNTSGLVAGKTYIIAYYDDTEDEGYTAGEFYDKYFTQNTASTFSADGSKITEVGEGTQEFILGGSSGLWTFTCASGTVRAIAIKKLALSGDSGDDTWNISISSGEATIESNTEAYGYLKYNPSSPRFLNYKSTSEGMVNPSLYVGGSGATYSTSASSCVDCDDAGAYFTLGEEVKKNTESANFTNTVEYAKENTMAQQWSSSNNTVADVDPATGEVTITGEGTTTITMKQAIDVTNDPDNVCAVRISYTLTVTKPTVEVVEVTKDDEIIIEHDMDATNSTLVLSKLVEGITGNVADDIFISKYFEAASNMKLFGIYNGTMKYIDLTKLRIRSNSDETHWSTAKGQLNYLEFKDIKKLGEDFKDYRLPPCTELIFWSNNQAGSNYLLRNCINMTIDGIAYDYDDMEAGDVPHWYCLGDPISYDTKDTDGNNQFVFNGDDGLILERTNDGGITWEAIDLFGAGTSAAPVTLNYANKDRKPAKPEGNGKIKVVTPKTGATNDTELYTINSIDNTPLNDGPGGFWAMENYDDNTEIPLSTNRYYLVRKNTVKSGYDAVANNTEVFSTLITEWTGKPVGGNNAAFCYSGEMFSEVGQYDFANYYSNYEDLDSDEYDFIHNSDGTYSVSVNNLTQYSCKSLRVEVRDATDPTDVKARVDYQVPIIVKNGTKTTIDEIFTDHGAEECASCNVVVLNGATLQKAASGTINEINDLEIYPGGKLDMQTGRELSINQLIMRSRGDEVPRVATHGTLNRTDATIFFDKRIMEDRWYWFTLPFDCDISDICFRNPEAAAPIYGVDYIIKYYDGARRATGVQSGNWKVFEGTTLKAGVGYQLGITPLPNHDYLEIRFPMKNANLEDDNRNTINVPVKAYGATTDVRPNHLGWNLVGNPFLDDYLKGNIASPLTIGKLEKEIKNGAWTGYWNLNKESGLRYIVIPTEGGYGEYEQVAIGEKDIEPFMSYFVQIDGSSDGEELNVEFHESNLPASAIRRRMVRSDYDEQITWVGVVLANSNDETDKTTLLIGESFTDEYDMMNDLVKMRGDKYTRVSKPVLASRNNEGEMAFNALTAESAEAGVPLHYFAAASGDYTFSLNDNYSLADIEKVELYDGKLQTTTDLLWSDYTFQSERTDDKSRFRLSVQLKKSPNIATSSEYTNPLSEINILGGNGQLMISSLPENAMVWIYTADGKLVEHLTSGSKNILYISVPQSGIYNVRIESEAGSQSFKTIVK